MLCNRQSTFSLTAVSSSRSLCCVTCADCWSSIALLYGCVRAQCKSNLNCLCTIQIDQPREKYKIKIKMKYIVVRQKESDAKRDEVKIKFVFDLPFSHSFQFPIAYSIFMCPFSVTANEQNSH